jgi:UDP-2,3-diacylglucosamine hydrolase
MPNGRHLFVSDLHLDVTAPEAVTQFRSFLRNEAHGSAGLYILGDLFETWIGDDDDEAARNTVCAALLELTLAGTPCYVLRGNRDFLLDTAFEQRTGCRLLPDPTLLKIGKVCAVISHGDLLCTADHAYQQFRSLTRTNWFQTGFLHLPLRTRRALALLARAGSREHTRQLRSEIMDVEAAAVESLLRCGNSSLLIHGHTHRPGVHQLLVDGRRATRIVLGDWYDHGSCLVLDADGNHELLTLPRGTAHSFMQPAAPQAHRNESGTADPAR